MKMSLENVASEALAGVEKSAQMRARYIKDQAPVLPVFTGDLAFKDLDICLVNPSFDPEHDFIIPARYRGNPQHYPPPCRGILQTSGQKTAARTKFVKAAVYKLLMSRGSRLSLPGCEKSGVHWQ